MKTFRLGIHPNDNKVLSCDIAFEVLEPGKKVFIPLSQHTGSPAKALVKVGDTVRAGTMIGEAGGYVSANVFSSISGTVTGIVERDSLSGYKTTHIEIENDGLYTEENLPPLEELTPQNIIERVKYAGIVGMGGAAFPTHVKLSPPNKIKTLIINGAECEPYITADYRLMLEKSAEVIEGALILQKALNPEETFIGVENNKKPAIKALREHAPESIKVEELKTKYPQGGEKQIIYAIKKQVVPVGKLPSHIGVVVVNAATAYAVYEAVRLGRPSYARYLTVSGGAAKNKLNLFVRNGTPFSEIAERAEVTESEKVISGGPMMGNAVYSLDIVATKGTNSLLFLTKDEVRKDEPTPCINCAACHKVCPMRLMPMFIEKYTRSEEYDLAEKYKPIYCMECGCCSYVCPARRPLVQSIRLAKKMIKERKNG